MSERYYINGPLDPGPVEVGGAEAHHLAAVCRLRPGDRVVLFNGDGRQYPAEVAAVGKRRVTLTVRGVEAPARELGFRLEVAAPLPRGDRAQFLVEKLTELGVTAFVPLCTARSVVHPGDARMDKLQRHVVEASKQCGRNVLLRVEAPADWDEYCVRGDLPPVRLLAHPGGATTALPAEQDCAVAVGPEGGFRDEEVARGRAAGWQVIDLGPRILRVETAALALAARLSVCSESPSPRGGEG
jgi:16S rRNA (uracil1498-N3)-methyltransferase